LVYIGHLNNVIEKVTSAKECLGYYENLKKSPQQKVGGTTPKSESITPLF